LLTITWFRLLNLNIMEISKLENEMKYVEINGCTLSVDERMRIDLGCCELVSQI
jgi:hypothetical protein